MKKKILSIILALTMVLGMVPFAGFTSFAAAQKIGDSDVTWELTDGNTTLVLGGTGAMPDFECWSAPWAYLGDSITTLKIGSGITKLGENAFDRTNASNLYIEDLESWCKLDQKQPYSYPSANLSITKLYVNGIETTEVTIPDSITEIPARCFFGFTMLTSVTIPSSVTSIGDYAFGSCAFESIELPSSVTSIGDGAFHSCAFESIELPKNLTSIGVNAFTACYALKSIVIPGGVKNISFSAVNECPELESVVILDGVESIGNCAFQNCENLTNVILPASLKSIGHDAFSYDPLENIVIPKNVESIDYFAFASAEHASVTFLGQPSIIGSEEGDIFAEGEIGTLILPATWEGEPEASEWGDCDWQGAYIATLIRYTHSFAGGDGSADSPYQIGTKAQLEHLPEIVNGGTDCTDTYFELTDNIGSTNDPVTTTIGSEYSVFNGHFNGNGHTVTVNLTGESDYYALFPTLGEYGEIINLTTAGCVSCVSDEEYDYVGGVCGYNYGTIANCCNTAEVSGDDRVGGVCGQNYGTITNCCNTGTVNGDDSVGGVCGGNDVTITNCYNTGTVNGGEESNNVGGVCGYNWNTITNCYNTGTVNVDGESYSVGGVCGQNNGTITNCYNTGTVNGNENVGGVCGCNDNGTITNCYNTGTVSGNSYFGGVCGYNWNTITNCYYDNAAYNGDAVGYDEGTTDCCGLSATQMKAASGSTLSTDVANNKPLVDLLNEYVKNSELTDLCNWKNEQGEYPVLVFPTAHTHNFTYALDEQNDNVIIATCANEDGNCDLTDNEISLTLTADGGTYNGNSFPATTDDDTVKFTETTGTTLELTYTKGADAVTELKNAGDYTATLTVKEDDAVVATATKDFTVAKAEQTITANNKTVIYGDTGATVGAAAEGTLSYAITSGDSVTVDENGALTIVKLGDTVITVSAAETENYNAATKDVTVTVKNNEKTISVIYMYDDNSEKGSITLSGDGITVNEDTTVAVVGSTVTVTDTPASENYKLKSLVVSYGGEIHDITDTKTFTMPNTDVTVMVEFKLFSARLDELLALFETLDEKDYTADTWRDVMDMYEGYKHEAEDAAYPEELDNLISALEGLICCLEPIFYVDEYGVLQRYKGEATEVEIPATVNNVYTNGETQVIWIGTDAFRGNTNITKVTIPDSVISIDGEAFSRCSKLKSVVLPNSLESLEDGMFQDCKALESIVLPANLSTVRMAFVECTALKSVTVMPEQLVSFSESSFTECGTLTIKVPAKLVDDYIKAYQTDETFWEGYTIEAIPHTHSFSYEAKDNTITATCADMAGKYCPMEEAITLTLTADGGTYNGNSFAATTDDATVKFTETTGATIGDILYSGAGITGTTTTAPKNAGTYTATVTVTYGESQTATLTKEFTIAKANATVTADDTEKTYGDTDPTFTATVTGTVGEDVLTYTIERAEGTDAGTYAITPTGDAVQGNYNVSYVPGTLTINRKAISVPTAETNLTYNEQEQTGVLAGTGYTLTGNTATDAGNHTATATPTANYKWADGTTAAKDITWTIAKADYDGTVTATGSITAFKNSTVDITLPALPDGASYGTPTGFTFGTASVSGTTLTLTVGGTDITGGLTNFTVTVPVTGATNYENYDVTVTVTPVYHAHSFNSENWTADGANGHYHACIGTGTCDVTDFTTHTADGFAFEAHTYTDFVCSKCGYNDVAGAITAAVSAINAAVPADASEETKKLASDAIDALDSLTTVAQINEAAAAAKTAIENAYNGDVAAAKEDAIAAINAAVPTDASEETKALAQQKIAALDSIDTVTAMENAAAAAKTAIADDYAQSVVNAKTAAAAALDAQNGKDPLNNASSVTAGKESIANATTLSAVKDAKNTAISNIQAAQAAELAAAKADAKAELTTQNNKDPLNNKTALNNGNTSIENAATKAAVQSAKNTALGNIQATQADELKAAKAAANTALDSQNGKDPLKDTSSVSTGKDNIGKAATKAAVESAKNTALGNIQSAQTAQLNAAKTEAINTLNEVLNSDVSDNVKAAAQRAIDKINAAKTVKDVESIASAVAEEMQSIIDEESKPKGLLDRIKSFFQKIIDWFKGIFEKLKKLLGIK